MTLNNSELYIGGDGSIILEEVSSGLVESFDIEDLVQELIEDFGPEQGQEPTFRLTREQTADLYDVYGKLVNSAAKLSTFILKYGPR